MVTELVAQARRRFLCNEVLAQGAWALSAAMAAVIVLLLAGTQILDWQWLLLLPLATCAAGVWRMWKRLPAPYAIAQLVDRRLRLADTLSTAYFFERLGRNRPVSPETRALQHAQAERLCAGVRVSEAVPFTMPRAVYALAILGVAASSLFALRYGLERKLELRQPLASILQQAFGLQQEQLAALERKQPPARKRPDIKGMDGLSVNQDQLPNNGEFQPASQPMNANSPAESTAGRKQPMPAAKQMQAPGDDGTDENGSSQEESGKNAGEQQSAAKGGQDKQGSKQAGSRSSEGSDSGNSSLMAKFQEAMRNLMSRMKEQPGGASGGQRQTANGKNSRQGTSQDGKMQNGQQGQQQAGAQSAGQQGQQGSQSQTAENAAGRGSGQNGQDNAGKQPGSGVGRQDGDKNVKLAEQLAAMGKISEIIGKRSANVSGEVTVEVQNNNHQQLATPYSHRSASHAETTAEISRDEVPVALQSYVQQYFEQVRRIAPESTEAGKR